MAHTWIHAAVLALMGTFWTVVGRPGRGVLLIFLAVCYGLVASMVNVVQLQHAMNAPAQAAAASTQWTRHVEFDGAAVMLPPNTRFSEKPVNFGHGLYAARSWLADLPDGGGALFISIDMPFNNAQPDVRPLRDWFKMALEHTDRRITSSTSAVDSRYGIASFEAVSSTGTITHARVYVQGRHGYVMSESHPPGAQYLLIDSFRHP